MGDSIQPVYLNVYNFTSLNGCLDVFGLGAYHTGIQIYGFEFCYFVVDDQSSSTGILAIEPERAGFPFETKLFLGETNKNKEEIQTIIDELSAKYTCGNYHMFKFNCNHFSQDFASKLVGKSLPSWLFRSTNLLKYACCCLPEGLVSGRWAIQALNRQIEN